jgi:peptidyl-prolyl cis-trans isomerase C
LIRLFASLLVAATALSGAACRKPTAASQAPAGAAQAPQPAAGQPAAGQPATGQPATPPSIKPMPAQLPDVLARVNGEAVTKVDLDRMVKNMELSANKPVPAERRDEILRQVLDQLVTYTVLSQETRTRQVKVTDTEVEGNVKQMRAQFPNEAEFNKALAARGLTIEKLRSDARVDLSINKMMEAEMATQPLPSDAQVREFYDKNPDKFETVRASHILFKFDEKADDASKKKLLAEAQAVLTQAKGGSDFAELARKHSKDGSAAQGGDLDFFPRGKMVPAFDQAAFALLPGQISDIVTTQFGYHIIKQTDRRPVPFEQVSERIKQFLAEQQKQQRAQAFVESLKQKAKIEVLV